jgi:glycosyltransferase involved in cell wall biosynthesis
MPTQKTTKKLLFVITKSNWGGAQKYVYTMAVCARDQYETSVLLGGDGVLKQKLDSEKIRVIPIPSLFRDINIIKDLMVFFQILQVFRKERPDIVHLNSSKIGVLGALAARASKVPRIIFTAHGFAFNEERGWLSKNIFYFFHWLTILFSHQTILVSRALARDLKNAPFIKRKLVVIHNGIEEFPLENQDVARRALLAKEMIRLPHQKTLWIGAIAELHRNKGLSYAITAIKRLKSLHPNTHFVFVVLGEGDERKNLENLIQNLELEENVFLIGHRKEAASLLPAFDIFLSSSTTEALSFVVLEAGISGLPVIATAVGGIPEIIDDMKSGILVRSKNPEEMVKAFEFLLAHPKEAAAFGKKLRSNIKKNFSLRKMLRETIAVYAPKK